MQVGMASEARWSQRERDERRSEGYNYEGVACDVFDPNQAPGTQPLFRAVNLQTGENFYTADFQELITLAPAPPPIGVGDFIGSGDAGWIYDLNQASVPPGAVPLDRLFTP